MNRTEIVLEALGIEVKKTRGRRAWALCPFHHDHQPTNFFIRISGQRAGQSHCFACKKGGTLADLVMHIRSCDFEKAKSFIEKLGRGYEPPRARVRVFERPAVLGRVRFKMPAEVILDRPLEDWVSTARSYVKEREITPEEVDRYGLGYAVDRRLGGRIVIPWRAQRTGVAMGYSARSFVGDDIKYMTPHESENADLDTMFGEHTWTEHREAVVVTEGALNAMAVARALDDYRVDIAAIGGSDVRAMHVVKLAEFPVVIILTDPDLAGDKAAATMGGMLGRHTQTKRIRLPDKHDALDVGRQYLREELITALHRLGVTSVLAAS